ncbi:MAG: AAA family ATPase [Firmicutes bacterium]|nr:AAA family ATPase [Bacillota bacterium]
MKLRNQKIIVIDGMSGSGKTTAANIIAKRLDGVVIGGDRFLLKSVVSPEKRKTVKNMFGGYPKEGESGIEYLERCYPIATVEQERALFNELRQDVERQILEVIKSTNQIDNLFIVDWMTSNKFEQVWDSADYRIMVDSNPEELAHRLVERLKLLTYYQEGIVDIREQAFRPLLADVQGVDFNPHNNYDVEFVKNIWNMSLSM